MSWTPRDIRLQSCDTAAWLLTQIDYFCDELNDEIKEALDARSAEIWRDTVTNLAETVAPTECPINVEETLRRMLRLAKLMRPLYVAGVLR